LAVISISLCQAQENYMLSSESTLSVDGTSTLHDWTVTANTISGSLVKEANTLKKVTFKVEVGGIISERGATMDKKAHNALNKEEHPYVLFSATDIDFATGEGQIISGKLTIAGVEKEVPVTVAIIQSGEDIQMNGTQKIILQDFGMEPPTAMFGSIVVGDEVTVKFNLSFAKQ